MANTIRDLMTSNPTTIEDGYALDTALEWLRESYYLKAPAKLRDAAFAE